MILRVHALAESSRVNGPGCRAVLWLQGCQLGCPQCFNVSTHSMIAGFQMEVSAVTKWIHGLWDRNIVSGLTVSGGEPMEQASALALVLEVLHHTVPVLSIGLFSGYSEAELDRGLYRGLPDSAERKRDLWRRIQRQLDFAVLGRYDDRKPSSDPLVTSTNQVLRLYSDHYSLADFQPQSVEVSIDATGLTQITGFPVRGPL
jgi:anaerobic ribonucleoside-triphosphate reductase activating protein